VNENRVLAVDGTNLTHRCFHAGADVADAAVLSMVATVARLVRTHRPSHLAVAFDPAGGCPSRFALAPSYKAGRADTPAELRAALDALPDVLTAGGVAALVVGGWEADDVIASACTAMLAADGDADVVVVSADKDLHQLVCDRVRVVKPEGTVVDDRYLVAKYGVSGARWVEYAALVGEKSDNLAGVDGIGPKRAAALVAGCADAADAFTDPALAVSLLGASVAGRLAAGRDAFARNRQVATLRRDLAVDLGVMSLAGFDESEFRARCQRAVLERRAADRAA
jgi:DNA polymerase I